MTTVGLWAPATNDSPKVYRSVYGVPRALSIWSKIANRDVQGTVCDTETSEDSGAVSYAMHSFRPQWPSCQCTDGQMHSCAAVCSVHRERTVTFSCLTQLAKGSNLAQAVSVGCCRFWVALDVELLE